MLQERDNLTGKATMLHNSFFMDKLHNSQSFAYTYSNIEKWTKCSIFQKSLIIIPINIRKLHWKLMSIFMSHKIIVIYDPQGIQEELNANGSVIYSDVQKYGHYALQVLRF